MQIEAMTQTSTNPSARAALPKVRQPQNRLVLQDPAAFEQLSQPVLRNSWELAPGMEPAMERDKARELWEI